jgi:molecular chaperone DnaK (HSP70)
MGKIVGIDLGTSNSAAAVMIAGKPTIIQAAEGTSIGGKAFPSTSRRARKASNDYEPRWYSISR